VTRLTTASSAEENARLESAWRSIPSTASPFERWHLFSLACLQQGSNTRAEDAIRRAIVLAPDQDSPWKNLSYLRFHAGEDAVALHSIRKACFLDPCAADARIRAGLCLLRLGEQGAAGFEFRAGLCLEPTIRSGNLNLGVALDEQQLVREAMVSLFREIKVYPDTAAAYVNLGNTSLGMGLVSEAAGYFDTAIDLGLKSPSVLTSSALAHLSCGNFEIGWSRFESRFHLQEHQYALPQLAAKRPLIGPGCPAAGTVLVWAEQGLGDEIMFGSLLTEFAPQCDRLIVQIDKRLLSLFRRSFGPGFDFIERGAVPDESLYDRHLPIGGLGRLLRPTLQSFAGHDGVYLVPDGERVREMRSRLLADGARRVIGISWKTANAETLAARNVAVVDLVAALSRQGVRLVNLQYGHSKEELEAARAAGVGEVWQYPGLDTQNDIDGVAALIQACDLVVSIGNAVAHLSGAVGKRAFVLLPRLGVRAAGNRVMPGWRWLAGGDTSIWYQSIRLFRCSEDRDWGAVLAEVSAALDAFLAEAE
jgi:Tfp pilus assembly protein PilF